MKLTFVSPMEDGGGGNGRKGGEVVELHLFLQWVRNGQSYGFMRPLKIENRPKNGFESKTY